MRTYLDNAATSWPKPESVYQAVGKYLRENGAPAGRSGYREAAEVERIVSDARRLVAGLLNVSDPSRVVFTSNGTDSLNLALHGLLRAGDHVVTTVVEHNSVLRPLRNLEQRGEVEVSRVRCDQFGIVDPADVKSAIRPNTRLIAAVHASNVTGAIQPVEAFGELAADHDVLFLVDAAQSLGHIACEPDRIGAHLVAAPGHKGMLGLLGTGILYVAPGVEHQLQAVRQGGTGTQSEDDAQPDTLPEKYESGNHNVPGIVGLKAGLEFIRTQGLDSLRQHEVEQTGTLLDGLNRIAGISIYGPRRSEERLGVVSLSVDGYDPQEVASMLDTAYSIQVRSGFHCAPLMHNALGTTRLGGAIRVSLGPFNTDEQVELFISSLVELSAATLS